MVDNTPPTQIRFAVLLLLLMSFSFGAAAEDGITDGSSLLADCGAAVKALDNGGYAKADSVQRIGFCYGYVEGVMNSASDNKVCLPNGGIARVQVVRIFVKYLQANPANLHLNVSTLLKSALADAFPCK